MYIPEEGISATSSNRQFGSWLLNKCKIRNTLEEEKKQINNDLNASFINLRCESLEENYHILKHCNKFFLSIMDPDNFSRDLECITTVDRKKVCRHLMGENKFSLLHIAVLLENTRNLKKFLNNFGSDLETDQLSGKHCISAMHIAAQGNYAEGIDLLLENKENIDLPDSRLKTPLYHAVICINTDATMRLISKGAALNTIMSQSNLTTLELVLRNTPSVKQAIIERLDESITLNGDSVEDKIYINFDLTQWKMGTGDGDQTQSVHAYDLVHAFAKEKTKFKTESDSDLIEHPLVQKMLEDASTGNMMRIIYYIILAFKFLFMVLITVYVWNGRRFQWLCWFLLGVAIMDVLTNSIALFAYAKAKGFSLTTWKTLFKDYLTNIQFYCHWTRVIGSFLFFCSENEVLLEMTSPMIFLAGWFDVMVMVGEFKCFGLYIYMFYCVMLHFFKILFAFGIFLIGYAICFWMYFHQQSSFSMFALAISKVVVMFIGELDYNDLIDNYMNQTLQLTARNGTTFNISPSEAPQWYLIFPLTCICLFVITVPIILQGLLIGIVVNDITVIYRKANALRLRISANRLEYLINSVDSFFLIKFPLRYYSCDVISCLDAPIQNNIVKVEYLIEDSSQPKYLHTAYEIAKKNASTLQEKKPQENVNKERKSRVHRASL